MAKGAGSQIWASQGQSSAQHPASNAPQTRQEGAPGRCRACARTVHTVQTVHTRTHCTHTVHTLYTHLLCRRAPRTAGCPWTAGARRPPGRPRGTVRSAGCPARTAGPAAPQCPGAALQESKHTHTHTHTHTHMGGRGRGVWGGDHAGSSGGGRGGRKRERQATLRCCACMQGEDDRHLPVPAVCASH